MGQHADMVWMTVSGSPGTGTVTLSAAVTGYLTFALAGIVNGQTVRYKIVEANTWEIGEGVYTSSGTSLSRATVEITSAGNTTKPSFTSAALVSIVSSAKSFVHLDYTPSMANTYSHTLYEDWEWDRIDTQRFLTATQRSDPLANDCWQSIQNFADYMMARKNGTSDGALKHMRLAGRAYKLSQTLKFTGSSAASVRQGRVMMTGGSLVAASSWANQATTPDPMIEFTTDSQGSGMQDVYVDCNGVCSGVLVNMTSGGNSKITIRNNVILNFANPQKPLQSDLYSNTISIGGAHLASPIPIRAYESSSAHPYGLRVGPKIITSTLIDSATCRISGNHIRQWEVGRTELSEFDKRTGIGIWLAGSDTYVEGEMNNVADCLKSLVVDGHSNTITSMHSSPSGGGVIVATATAWTTNHAYVVGNYVSDNSKAFYCTVNHTSGASSASNKTPGTATVWAASTGYVIGDIVKVGSNGTTMYICITNHTSASSIDLTKFTASWTDVTANTGYNADNAPTPNIYLIGTEHNNGHNTFNANYHERMMWLRDKRISVTMHRFPRNSGSTDGNTACIMFDATSVGESLGTSGAKLIIMGGHRDGDLDAIQYREVDGTFAAKLDVTQIGNNHFIFSAGQHVIASGDDAGDTPLVVLASHDTRSLMTFRGRTSTANIKMGIVSDKYELRSGATTLLQVDTAASNFRTTAGARTALQNGSVTFHDALGAFNLLSRTVANLNSLATVGAATAGRTFWCSNPGTGQPRQVWGNGTNWVDYLNTTIATPV